jgi:acyl-CoA thioester hydrolase
MTTMDRNDEPLAFAAGRFVHAYVDLATRKPMPLPPGHVQDLRTLLIPASPG